MKKNKVKKESTKKLISIRIEQWMYDSIESAIKISSNGKINMSDYIRTIIDLHFLPAFIKGGIRKSLFFEEINIFKTKFKESDFVYSEMIKDINFGIKQLKSHKKAITLLKEKTNKVNMEFIDYIKKQEKL